VPYRYSKWIQNNKNFIQKNLPDTIGNILLTKNINIGKSLYQFGIKVTDGLGNLYTELPSTGQIHYKKVLNTLKYIESLKVFKVFKFE
jgi:hypothetical protein